MLWELQDLIWSSISMLNKQGSIHKAFLLHKIQNIYNFTSSWENLQRPNPPNLTSDSHQKCSDKKNNNWHLTGLGGATLMSKGKQFHCFKVEDWPRVTNYGLLLDERVGYIQPYRFGVISDEKNRKHSIKQITVNTSTQLPQKLQHNLPLIGSLKGDKSLLSCFACFKFCLSTHSEWWKKRAIKIILVTLENQTKMQIVDSLQF